MKRRESEKEKMNSDFSKGGKKKIFQRNKGNYQSNPNSKFLQFHIQIKICEPSTNG